MIHEDSRAAMLAECSVAITEILELMRHARFSLNRPATCVKLVDAAAQHFQVLRANVGLLAEREEV